MVIKKLFSRPLHFVCFVLTLLLVSQNSFATASSALVGADANEHLLIKTSWLLNHIENKNVVILDVRPSSEYLKSHIKNAINIPMADTNRKIHPKDRVKSIKGIQILFSEAGINALSNIVIYDDGEFIDSGRVFWVFEVYGHRRVSLLDKGFSGWIKENLPVTSIKYQLPYKKFIAEVQPKKLKTKLHTRLAINDKNKIIIDSRSKDEYFGMQSFSKRYGHIPNAINIPWHKNFRKVNGVTVIIGKEALNNIYKDIDKNKEIITYCNKGRHSSFTYFILRTMGHDVAHYDGSWYEWGNDPNLPIHTNIE